ncbi:MAG: hypothetical protein II956_03775 [Bacteroidales bacterium]|nr:hypothetical protein [Bacteroidales bacterium]
MNTTTIALRSQQGRYSVNKDHIIISEPQQCNIADIQEQAIAAGQILNGRNIALYGMAALIDDPENPGRQHLASNATLVNEGIIEIHLDKMVKAYKDQIKKNPKDENGIYRFIKCFAMAAGKNSMIVNNGVIKVYFDYDDNDLTPVYGETLLAGESSTIINNGEIQLLGNGSYNTQARAIAVPADNMTIVNNGKISLDMLKASTIRILATTGKGGSILNYGKIFVKSQGRIMTVARFADTNMINAGEIELVSVAKFIENKVSFLYQSYPLACAFYEHFLPNENPVPPIINSGKIKIHLEGSQESTEKAVAFGIYSELVGQETQCHVFENTGEITLTKSGPFDFQIAEVGFNVQSAKDMPFDVEIRRWKTKKRDFNTTKDLFVCGSGRFDLSKAEITDFDGAALPKDGAVIQNEENLKRGDTFSVKLV